MPPSSPRPLFVVGGTAILLLGGACRSAAPPASTTTVDGHNAFDTPAGALEALDAAEAQLFDEVAFSLRREAVGKDDDGTDTGRPLDAASSPEAAPVSRQPRGRCSRACAALASMIRAADRLCQLTGEDEDRCQSARRRVEAGRRVVERHCPSCDA